MMNQSYPMNEDLWKPIKNFAPEDFGCIDMNGVLVYTLQNLRNFVNRPIIVHCGYEPRGTGGYHPLKCAVDIHIERMNVIDQFLAATRFDAFNGIGVYPNWNSPGLHLDTRCLEKTRIDARWGCFKSGKYLPLDSNFFRKAL